MEPQKISSLEDIRKAKEQLKLEMGYTRNMLVDSVQDVGSIAKKSIYDEGIKKGIDFLSTLNVFSGHKDEQNGHRTYVPANHENASPWVRFFEDVLPRIFGHKDKED